MKTVTLLCAGVLPLAALLVNVSCASGPPRTTDTRAKQPPPQVAPLASGSSAPATGPVPRPPKPPCERAAELLTRVPGLLAEGRLDRSRRALARAAELCPERVPETWAPQLEVLGVLGDVDAQKRLAGIVLGAPAAPEPARKAAQEAQRVTGQARTPESLERGRKAFQEAAEAWLKQDYAAAQRRALETWADTSPPAEALVLAGRAALAKGERTDAQKLFDRALHEATRSATASSAGVTGPDSSPGLELPTNDFVQFTVQPGARAILALQTAQGDVTVQQLDGSYGPRIGLASSVPVRAALSPDGTRLFLLGRSTFADRESVLTYDLAAAQLLRVAPVQTGTPSKRIPSITHFSLSPDGTRVGAYGYAPKDYALWLVDLEKERLLGSTTFDSPILAMRFTPDGRYLAVRHFIEGGQFGKEDSLRLYDAASTKRIRQFIMSGRGEVPHAQGLAVSPDGALLAAFVGPLGEYGVLAQSTLRLFDVKTGKERARCENSELRESHGSVIAFSPDGATVAALYDASPSGPRVRLWDAKTCTEQPDIPVAGTASDFAFVDRDHIAVLSGGVSSVIDLRSRQTTALPRPLDPAYSVRFSPSGRYLAVGLDDGAVTVWDVEAGAPRFLRSHQGSVDGLAFSSDGKRLATGGGDGALILWDTTSWQPTSTLHVHGAGIEAIAFSPDGKRILSTSFDKTARLSDAATGAAIWTFPHTGALISAAFSPDGTRVAVGAEDGTLFVLDAATGRPSRELRTHGAVESAFFTGDSELWSWSMKERSLRRWDPGTGEMAFERKSPRGARFMTASCTADGKQILLVDEHISILDAASGALVRTLEPGRHASESLYDVAFSPDGRLAAGASPDGSLYLWRVDQERPLLTLLAAEGHDAAMAATEEGYIDFLGPEAARLRQLTLCTVGTQWFPFDVCEERLRAPGLVAKILQDDPSFREP